MHIASTEAGDVGVLARDAPQGAMTQKTPHNGGTPNGAEKKGHCFTRARTPTSPASMFVDDISKHKQCGHCINMGRRRRFAKISPAFRYFYQRNATYFKKNMYLCLRKNVRHNRKSPKRQIVQFLAIFLTFVFLKMSGKK